MLALVGTLPEASGVVAKSSRMPLSVNFGDFRLRIRRISLLEAMVFALAAVACFEPNAAASAQDKSSTESAPALAQEHLGVEIVEHGTYPELRVDGEPFFIHSAAFFYYRIPRDEWEHLLDRYQRAGINTIDLYIPWNWHEPKEGEVDFDGRTNPRRDLRTLLKMIAERHLRLIARPGPEILNEWRNGGYPDWLLKRPEYKMDPIEVIEGRYPPLDDLNAKDAEAAAVGWLGNRTHMQQARRWLAEVGKELAPYSSRRAGNRASEKRSEERSGPLLFVQLGDDLGIGRANRTGESFWEYAKQLRKAIEAGGVDVPVFINPADMRVPAEGAELEPPIGVMGQWYLPSVGSKADQPRTLRAEDASEIEFLTEELETQPDFPPAMIEFQAGWYAPADDDHPPASPAENTLLSSRLMIGNGLHGINYFPLQDTFTPAGYSVPWANRSYRWNAALSTDGEARPELSAIDRNANLLNRWGGELAASHKRVDLGIIDPTGSYPEERLTTEDIEAVSRRLERIERTGMLAMISTELVDPEHQPPEQMLRDPAILLPVFDPDRQEFQISEKAQKQIVEYVRSGGTLILYLGRPAGEAIEELWEQAPEGGASSRSAIRDRWKFGKGEVIECTKDFDSWVELDQSLTENLAQRDAPYSMGLMKEIVSAAGIETSVRLAESGLQQRSIIATELVENEGTEALGKRKGTKGFLSITNLGNGEPADVTLDVLTPEAPATRIPNNYVPVHAIVPPRESLLLPLNQPICFENAHNAPCGDVMERSGAEFLDAKREDKTLELLLYVPAKAELLLRMSEQPAHVTLDDSKPDSQWTPESNELRVTVPRGPAPSYLRLLKIDLPNTPHVPKVMKEGKPTAEEFSLAIWNAVRLPVSGNEFLRTYPPLILSEQGKTPSVVLSAFNLNTDYPRDAQVTIDGPFHGSEAYRIAPESSEIERIRLKSSEKETGSPSESADRLMHETIVVKSGQDRRVIPVTFVSLRAKETTAYKYDFDRDGADEWVLENAALRMIVSPESGGRTTALMDKTTGEDLSTSVGLARDNFAYTPNPEGIDPERALGLYGTFNRVYTAEWGGEAANPSLEMQYEADDVYPAGASIEKRMRLEDPATLRVDYRVKLLAGKSASETPEQSQHPQAFVAVNSFPASDRRGHQTQFCWKESTAGASAGPPTGGEETGKGAACVDFAAGGKTIEVPAGARWVEVRSPEQPTVALEWVCERECARLRIEQKNFSGLFLLEFPALPPGGKEGNYTVRIRAQVQP
jgi:hypothetical protein